MSASNLIVWALSVLTVGSTPEDPRPDLVQQQLEQRYSQALAQTERVISSDPELADDLWLNYLRAHLLESLGRPEDAHKAFASLLSVDSELASYARLRMALLQARMGHPEVAAGLVATLLGRGAPPDTVGPATDLLIGALARGADCRLLGRLPEWRVPDAERRRLELALADCVASGGDSSRAAALFLDLLQESTDDLVGRTAALHLSELSSAVQDDPRLLLLIGMAFHRNREFARSTSFLERGLATLDPERLNLSPQELFAYRYANARGYFWLRRYSEAALRFDELASVAPRSELEADCLYQAGRSLELAGQWTNAATTFRRAYLADRIGEWSGPALLSAMRIELRTGKEPQALELYDVLQSRSAWQSLARRATLFLAASDLVRGRADRAAVWLQRPSGTEAAEEFLYWRGRTAELQDSPELAIRHYLEILRRDPHHPIADEASRRLSGGTLAPLLETVANQLASSRRRADLHSAWVLYGDVDERGQRARSQLEQQLLGDPRAAPYLSLSLVQPQQWPLWGTSLARAGERFLAIGVWSHGESYVLRHFPVSEPSLAFTGSALLARAGLVKPSLYVAEIMARRVPEWVPPRMLPLPYRRLLYPYPYRRLIQQHAGSRRVEPELLAGLIREESRFDPTAVSAASARGLTQFVYSTAAPLAPRLGVGTLRPEQLNDPELSIALGALYLAELLQGFDQRVFSAVTAYNAGEEQTRVWESYCYSRDPAEYYSKVGFPQTRSYLRKVLSSRNQYRELYAGT